MIFVTVGTHEQQFNRLIEEVDRLKKIGFIQDEVMIQSGFSDYVPKYCEWKNFLTFKEMDYYMATADIVVTHGGPASFMNAISKGKSPIVVPRQQIYNEHVNDHQLYFCNRVKELYSITVIEDIENLKDSLKVTDLKVKIKSNNTTFCEQLAERI